MDKMISVTETVKRRYLKQGIFFTIIGLLGLGVELTNVQRTIGIVLLLIQICALVLVIVYMKKTERVKKEEFDEMAEQICIELKQMQEISEWQCFLQWLLWRV